MYAQRFSGSLADVLNVFPGRWGAAASFARASCPRLASCAQDHAHCCQCTHFAPRIMPIAANAYVLVLVVDLASPGGMVLSEMVMQMWQGYYPIRMGESMMKMVMRSHGG